MKRAGVLELCRRRFARDLVLCSPDPKQPDPPTKEKQP